jgi:hypothetical protein
MEDFMKFLVFVGAPVRRVPRGQDGMAARHRTIRLAPGAYAARGIRVAGFPRLGRPHRVPRRTARDVRGPGGAGIAVSPLLAICMPPSYTVGHDRTQHLVPSTAPGA